MIAKRVVDYCIRVAKWDCNKLAKGWLPWFIGCTNCSKQAPFPKLLKGVFISFLVA